MEAERVEKHTDSSAQELLKSLAQWSEEQGNPEAADIFRDLAGKLADGELTLAFCGHFSAGKSSLINALCGSTVLPAGPVPTSANVVAIRSGSPRVVVYPRLQEGKGQPFETTPERLAELCRDGGRYESIEVWAEVPLLGAHGVLLDTPGVDSTDDGHRSATRSALHLADVVFYCMDYNHVQSEDNLAFAKSLSDWGKPLYLIVNQIDKHRADEIDAGLYRLQVESAFKDWGIRYAGLLTTSLKPKDHPLSQWRELPALIAKLLEERRELLAYSVSRSVQHTVQAMQERFQSEEAGQREPLESMTGGRTSAELQEEAAELEAEGKRLDNLEDESRGRLRQRLDTLLESANLMPAALRELVGRYAETLGPGFRVGLLPSAAKKERERERRLEELAADWSETTRAALDWHVRALLAEWTAETGLPEAAEAAREAPLPVWDKDAVAAAVPPGSPSSGGGLLNLCQRLAADIRAAARKSALRFADEALEGLPPLVAERREALSARAAAAGEALAAAKTLAALDRAAKARADALAAQTPAPLALTPGVLPGVTPPRVAPDGAPKPAEPRRTAAAPAPAAPRRGGAEPDAPRRRLRSAAAVLDAAAERLRREPALAPRARGLAERAAGLAGGRFTLALFGAFSAGKSSFANALLGEDVLPVSPHPATAAVTRILAPEGGYVHGTAAVAMKTADEFRDDLRHSFSVLELGEPDPEEWPKTAACLEGRGLHPSALPHIGFLRAAAAGWEASRGLLGSVRTVDLDEYRGLVADETKACFVRRIDLYYSSPLTEGGIVLVDTPGADSLHARHTGVTFGYMKEADAIVFLTYYNHAFSKADRALLAQLGRVKDSFALDKMFFIINASDLASDEEELDAVGEHVRTELRTAGLIAPRIYALSSLLALQGRRPGEEAAREASRFDRFQEELMRFAGEELPALSLRAASSLLSSTRRRVEEWAALASRNASEREEELRRRQDWRSEAEAGLRKLACEEMPLAALGREGEELLYHVRQRIGFKFGAMLQESFHPSLLREESGHLKGLFTASGRELWRTAQRELEGELWATTLRLEAAGRRLAAEAAAEEALRLGLDPSDLADREPDACWPSPEGLKAELEPVDWSAYTGLFRSPRHFFEGGGRDRLRSVVEPLLKNALAAAVQGAAGELLHHYRNLTSEALKRAADRLRQMLAEQDEAMEATLKGGESGEHWTALAAELQSREKDLEALSKG